MREVKFIMYVTRWYDGSNTYFTGYVKRVDTGEQIDIPFEYGYGSHCEIVGKEQMVKAGWINVEVPHGQEIRYATVSYDRENNYPIEYLITDVKRKRDMYQVAKEAKRA